MPDYADFYSRFVRITTQPNSQNEVKAICCFHDDHDPSMSINLETGLWKCFGCEDEERSGGDAIRFLELYYDIQFPLAREEFKRFQEGKDSILPIPEEDVARWHDTLLNRATKVLEYLQHERGLTIETVKKFQLGWDGQRITIPIRNYRGDCVNVRRYKPRGSGKNKMINYAVEGSPSFGGARLFPIDSLLHNNKPVLVCEGEMDTLVALQLGFNAVTSTGGAGVWLPQWADYFLGRTVYIVYDVDAKGRLGAQRVAEALYGKADKVFIVDLPLQEPPGADVTDYFVGQGYTKENFVELLKSTKPYVPAKETPKKTEDEDVHEVSLAQARLGDYWNKRVRMNVLVVGKDLAPYTIPEEIHFTCRYMNPEWKKCQTCQLNFNNGDMTVRINDHQDILKLIRCSDGQQQAVIREMVGIPKCDLYDAEVIRPQNVEELLLAPEVSQSETAGVDEQYSLQRAFYLAGLRGTAATNQSYQVEGRRYHEPWQQYATFLLDKIEPLQDSVSAFRMTPELKEKLKIFQPLEGQSVKDKFDEIHNDLAYNVTKIYGRNDVLAALDLVYHSVLQFRFQGTLVSKGWTECLIIGDTRTGKSESAERIMKHYGLGEMVFGENTSFAGLIGGMQQTQSRWFITWGKIPLNNRRLVVIDEASGLHPDDIARMSGVRSSGIAEVTKIQTERAPARTRLIWLSNPRSGRPLSDYGYGVEAVTELIGKAEDIARFDFVVSCASNEVPSELINSVGDSSSVPKHKYTAELCRALVLWAWSRPPESVIFTPAATKTILEHAIQMGKEYSSSIPLIEAANQRIKLARLAVAAAARVFSCDDSGERIVVHPEHADFAAQFLNTAYSKPSLAYKAYSEVEKENERVAERYREEVLDYVDAYPEVAYLFMRQSYVRSKDLEEQLNVDRDTAREHLHFFARCRMIVSTTGGYRKAPAFITLLREWRNGRKG